MELCMMKKSLLYAAGGILLSAMSAQAEGLQVTPYIKSSLNAAALNNILNSEQIFCYTVEMPSAGYTGYTLDQMALTGFCGILNAQEKNILVQELFANPENVSETSAKCVIAPRIVLRFYRGIDATDVLLSYPCSSFSVFYGGAIKSFNTEPLGQTFDGLAALYEKRAVPFVSPTLLNQMMPIGKAVTQEQKDLVEKATSTKKWTVSTPQPETQEKASKGWNKLNTKKN